MVQPRVKDDLRGLKALVGILGVAVVLGTALVIGIVIHRLYAKPAVTAPAAVPGVALSPAPSVLRSGEHIGGIAAAGAQVAIWVTGPQGDRVLLLDPATGRIVVALGAVP